MLNKAEDPLDVRKGLFLNPYTEDEEADDLGSVGITIRQSSKMTPVYRSAAAD